MTQLEENEDELIEAMPDHKRKEVMRLLAEDPSAELEEENEEPSERPKTPLQLKAEELERKAWERIPHRMKEFYSDV